MSNQSAMQKVRQEIATRPRGEPILMSSLPHLISKNNIKQIFHRLVASGELVRVARQIYIRPQKSKYVGSVTPSAHAIVSAISNETGEMISVHGAEAARQLGLSTQMPMRPIFNTTGNTRNINVGNTTIILRHVSPRKIVMPGTIAGLAITALWYFGKENVTEQTIASLKNRLTKEQFESVIQACNKMPEWMASELIKFKGE